MKQFQEQMQKQFDVMNQTGKLFKSSVTESEVWKTYLESFKSDPIFRDPESSEHNCNNCHNFIRRYGNIVAIDANNTIITMFDFEAKDEFKPVAKALSKKLKNAPVKEVFFETFAELQSLPYEKSSKNASKHQLGIDKNVKRYTKEEAEKFGVVKPNEIKTFAHMYVHVSSAFVDISGKSIEAIMGEYRDAKNVFQRAMQEIPLDTLNLVKDLINQGSLLDGQTHLYKIEQIIPLKEAYDKVATKDQDNWCWVNSYKLPFAKFRNELIGVLCSELAEGEKLNKACQSWNKRVDPANYMKATAPITKKQIEEAEKFIAEQGLVDSFNRRLATIEDIKVSEIKHMNATDTKIKEVSLFDKVKATAPSRHKRNEFDGVEEVPVEKFMKDILPTCTSVEVLVKNNHENNIVTLTTANKEDAKPIFKWGNNYSWSFANNLAGVSQLKEAVVARGGKVDGVFRFSHSWNELEPNQSLMDLHVFMPNCKLPVQGSGGPDIIGRRVGWNQRQDYLSKGQQDVDYVSAAPAGYIPVENITFPDINKMPEGVYTCMIHNWSFRKTGGRGKAEIAFEDEIFQYEYPATKNHQWIIIAEVTLKDKQFTIKHIVPVANEISKEFCGLNSNEFRKVNMVCLSPNHWDGNNVGNKHYFFMLDGCEVKNEVRGFHNENLIPDLVQHRKVLEVLGATHMIKPSKKQLSGLGFNATVKDELVVKLGGNFKRVVKIKF